MKDLFGLELPTPVTFAIAFIVVLGLIGLLAWAVRRFGATRLEAQRSRQPRLAVVDSAQVDGRRKLVIIRRDNVEHLLMIGGPTDVVVEASIMRGGAVAAREAPAVRAGADNLPRAMPLPDTTLWPLQPEPVMAPAPPPMPVSASIAAPMARPERTVRVAIDPRILTEHRPAPDVRSETRIETRMAPDPRIAAAEEFGHWPQPQDAAPASPPQHHADHLTGFAAGLAADLARPVAEAAPRAAPQPRSRRGRPEFGRDGATARSRAAPADGSSAARRRAPCDPRSPVRGRTANGCPDACRARTCCPSPCCPRACSAAGARRTAAGCAAARGSCGQGRRTAKTAIRQPRTRDGEFARPTWKNVTAGGIAACVRLTAAAAITLLVVIAPAQAQDVSINFGQGTGLTERVIQLVALLTVLSLAPSILVMMTSFTRIVVVLSLLRTALGTATAPPNAVIVALALFLTAFVMGPAFQTAYDTGVKPLLANEIAPEQAFERASIPFRAFMLKNVRDKDLKLFNDLSREPIPAQPEQISLRILIPAFMISELKRAFEIGFLLFLPFLIIDLVVASVLMSMGMMMLPPVVVSLPFKLIFFVLVDGWSLVAGSLVQSYGP